MKKFGSLVVAGSHQQLVALLSRLISLNSSEFVYDCELSVNYARNIFLKPDEVACFRALGSGGYDSTIWMAIQLGKLRVANIVPGSVSSLSISQYNRLLFEFFHSFVAKALQGEEAVYIDGQNLGAEDLLPAECFKKLRAWALTCNQDSPLAHPMDLERWFDFLEAMSLVPAAERMPVDDLIQWLHEDCGWLAGYRPERFNDISRAYEYGLDLLDYNASRL